MHHSTRAIAAMLAVLLLPAGASAQEPRATIHRDAWGAPHVLSDTDEGAVFGMAWALAEDDWPLIEENYLHALGRYAELVGEDGVRDDWMARALEIVPLSIREYENASPRMRGLLDAFAAGMNGWLATRTEPTRVLDAIEPWYPLALIRYKYYQNEYLGYAGLRGPWAARLFERGWPADGRTEGAAAGDWAGQQPLEDRYYEAQFDALGQRPRGSNEWAVAPSRTRDGHALLLINPHQSFVGVQRYAEIHIDSREGLRFSGLTVFGFLLPYMGHNDRLGWAYTDNYADHSDLYAIAFDDPDRPLSYRYGDGRRDAVAWSDSIAVRTGDGASETRRFEFRKTHHGPIVGIDDAGRPLAVRMARYESGGWFDQWDAMIRARSMAEWRAALAPLHVAYMNTMYADADGNIGYLYLSAVPRRLPGVDPSGILDGSDPRTEWQGFHELSELPQVWNPASGWLMNTNSTPFTATVELPFARDDFPAYMVGDEAHNTRAVSSRTVLESLTDVSFDEFARIVWDTRLSAADRSLPELFAQWGAGGPVSAEGVDAEVLADAVTRLRAWDRRAAAESVETTWFVLASERHALNMARGERRWVTALAGALRSIQEVWDRIDVPWGELNRHQRPLPGSPVELDRSRPSLPIDGTHGELGSVFSYSGRPTGEARPRLGRGGNSFVKVMQFGPEVRAASILNYGQSGDPASPHFFDQASLYARRSFKPAWFSREDVVANAVRSYEVR